MIRVIILLGTNNGYINTYHRNEEVAKQFIANWVERVKESMASHSKPILDLLIDEQGGYAVLAQCVVGMYIAKDEPTAADRIAAVVEKQTKEGEGWKDA